MRKIRLNSFGIMPIALLGIFVILTGQVFGQRNSNTGKRPDRGQNAPSARQQRPDSNAQRNRATQNRSVQQRQSAAQRPAPAARAPENRGRPQSQPSAGANRSADTNRQNVQRQSMRRAGSPPAGADKPGTVKRGTPAQSSRQAPAARAPENRGRPQGQPSAGAKRSADTNRQNVRRQSMHRAGSPPAGADKPGTVKRGIPAQSSRQAPAARAPENRGRIQGQTSAGANRSPDTNRQNVQRQSMHRAGSPPAGADKPGGVKRGDPITTRKPETKFEPPRNKPRVPAPHESNIGRNPREDRSTSDRQRGDIPGKGPQLYRNDGHRGDVKRNNPPDFGKRPIPTPPHGKGVPRPSDRGRDYLQDVRQRLAPPKGHSPHKAQTHVNRGLHVNRHTPMHKVDLHRISRGKSASSIKLAEQYRMIRHGDVARRMGLYKPYAPRPEFHRGLVSPHYHKNAFKYRYWGPSWYVGVHWYPRWDSWVRWSWGYSCDPYWDPRPIYCRPIVYQPARVWAYWATPVWEPLPVVAAGTWVDLPPAAVTDPRHDMQLVAVRFVDPGHPDEQLGPRYRVWFRNNGGRTINAPFDVMLFAGNDAQITAQLPQAGVRVTAIEPGEVQSVDIRLPIEVYEIERDEQGNPAPFSVLHVLVDAGNEIIETTEANNGASLAPADILPIDPAAFELDPDAAKSGSEVVLAGEGFGPQPGQVILIIDNKEIDAEILGWYDMGVRFVLPQIRAAGPIEAEVVVVRGDRAAANPLNIRILP